MTLVKERGRLEEGRDSWEQEAYLEAIALIQASHDENEVEEREGL